jgi:hypothetical protein
MKNGSGKWKWLVPYTRGPIYEYIRNKRRQGIKTKLKTIMLHRLRIPALVNVDGLQAVNGDFYVSFTNGAGGLKLKENSS